MRIIGNRMPLWSAIIAASKRSASPWIGRPTWSRLAQSHRPSCSTTTWSALIKACPVAIVLHAAPSPICLLSLPCQASSIPTGGSLSWMDCMWSAKSISTAWSALISNGTQSRPSSSAITSSCSSHGLRNEMHFATKDLQITLRCIHLLSGKAAPSHHCHQISAVNNPAASADSCKTVISLRIPWAVGCQSTLYAGPA